MTSQAPYWLNEEAPNREDHLGFAMERVRERKLLEAQQILGRLSVTDLCRFIREFSNEQNNQSFPSESNVESNAPQYAYDSNDGSQRRIG